MNSTLNLDISSEKNRYPKGMPIKKIPKRWNISIIVMIPKDGVSDHRALNHIPYKLFKIPWVS